MSKHYAFYYNVLANLNCFLSSVHLRLQEKLIVRLGRDGGVQQFELHGLTTLHIRDERWTKIRVQLENQNNHGIQLQTHPNVDKELFKMRAQVRLFSVLQ